MKKRIVQISRHSVCYFFMLTSIGCSKLSDQLGVETKAHTSTTAVRDKSVRRSVHAQRNSEVVGIPKMKTWLTLLLILSNPMPVGSNCRHYIHTNPHDYVNCCKNLPSNSNRNIGNFSGITAQWNQRYINIYDGDNARFKILSDIIAFGTMIGTKYDKCDKKYKNLLEKITKWDAYWNSWRKYSDEMDALLKEEEALKNSPEESNLNSNIDTYTQGIVREAIKTLKERFQSGCPQFNFEYCMQIVEQCLSSTSGNTVSRSSDFDRYVRDGFRLCAPHQTSVQCKNVGNHCVPFISDAEIKSECSRKHRESWCSASHSRKACNAMTDACADGMRQENLLWVCHAFCTGINNRTIVSDFNRNCRKSQGYPNQAIDQRGKRAIRLDKRGKDAERKDMQKKNQGNPKLFQGKSRSGNPFFKQSYR